MNGKFSYHDKLPELGYEFVVTGEAKSKNPDDSMVFSQTIRSYGQDSVLAIPEIATFAIFDGASGSIDIGDPLRASQVAATTSEQTAKRLFKNQPLNIITNDSIGVLDETTSQTATIMNRSRESVEADQQCGITTGLISCFRRLNGVLYQFYAQAGDSMISIYPHPDFDASPEDVLGHCVPEQTDIIGQLKNFIGRVRVVGERWCDDDVGYYSHDESRPRHTLITSDGISGHNFYTDGIDSDDLLYATTTKPLLNQAREKRVGLHVFEWLTGSEQPDRTPKIARGDQRKVLEALQKFVYNRELSPPFVNCETLADSIVQPEIIRTDKEPLRARDDKSLILIRPYRKIPNR